MLAEQVLEKSVELKRSTTKSPKLFVRAPPTALWEGSPPLPVQPSPACFRYLHETCKTMTDTGSDLWLPSALSILKNRLRSTIIDSLNDTLLSTTHTNGSTITAALSSGIDETSINGEYKQDLAEDGASVDDKAQEESTNTDTNTTSSPSQSTPTPKLIQATFDILYLDKILAVPAPSTSDFDTAITNLKSKA